MRSGSWVIVRKSDNVAVFETFSRTVADAVNRDRYDVLPAYDYLVGLNKALQAAKGSPR